MSFTEVLSSVGLLLSTAVAAYAVWSRSRAEAKIGAAKAEAEAKVAEAKVKADLDIAARDQIMKEYGLLIGELRETIKRERLDRQTAWEFQLRRGAMESVQRGVAKMDSPITFDRAKVEEHLAPVKDELLGVPWSEVVESELGVAWPEVSVSELTLLIERKLGEKIVDKVCRPLNIKDSMCLLMATALITGKNVLYI